VQVQHEVGDLGRLAVEELFQEVVRDRMAVQLDPVHRSDAIGPLVDRDRSHLQPGRPSSLRR
jgi:hypothetical protein